MKKIIIGIVFFVFIVGLVIYTFLEQKKEQETMNLLMQDERFKSVKQFNIKHPVAISPDGFIGIVHSDKMTIVSIKDIKSFQPKEKEKEIKEFLSELEKVEKNVKGDY